MKLLRLYIGVNDKDSKRPVTNMIKFMSDLKSTLNKYVDGYTLLHGTGYYTHDDGTRVQEGTVIVELIGIPMDIKELVNELKLKLNQESILCIQQDVFTEFI